MLDGFSIGQFAGALVATFLLSRLIFWLTRKWDRGASRIVVVHALSFAIATVLAAFGFADGGPPRLADAALGYSLPQLVWLVVDGIRLGTRPVSLAVEKDDRKER